MYVQYPATNVIMLWTEFILIYMDLSLPLNLGQIYGFFIQSNQLAS